MWQRSIPLLWGRNGFFTRMIRPYLRGFVPSFHPWQTAVPRGFVEFVTVWRSHPDALALTEAALGAAV